MRGARSQSDLAIGREAARTERYLKRTPSLPGLRWAAASGRP